MINYDVVKYFTKEQLWTLCVQLFENRSPDFVLALNMYVSESCDPRAIALFGAWEQRNDRHYLSEIIFQQGVERFPDNPEMWFGLATSIKDPGRWEESEAMFLKGLELEPSSTAGLANLSSLYNEVCMYDKALEYAQKSLDVERTIPALDGIAMASYGLEDYAKGGDYNTFSLGEKYRREVIYGDEPRWDGSKDKRIIIYGEQGIGDEIFYGSAIPDAIRDSKEVIIDCDYRLESLFKRSFPEASVYGTRDKSCDWMGNHEWDARCAMAGLWQFYRRKREDFGGLPYLKPCPVRLKQWLNLWKTRSGDNIGVVWDGGALFTNRKYRSFPQEILERLDGNLVNLSWETKETRINVENYPWATITNDYDNTAALVASLDYVVTCCQSIVHLCGGLGVPCYVLRPKYYTWRYANGMPMYQSVTVIECDGDWEKGIDEVIELRKKEKAA